MTLCYYMSVIHKYWNIWFCQTQKRCVTVGKLFHQASGITSPPQGTGGQNKTGQHHSGFSQTFSHTSQQPTLRKCMDIRDRGQIWNSYFGISISTYFFGFEFVGELYYLPLSLLVVQQEKSGLVSNQLHQRNAFCQTE